MARARKIERFLSQPFFVAEVFTGSPGVLVDLRCHHQSGFKGLCDGDYDHLPEQAFYMVGTIEDADQEGGNTWRQRRPRAKDRDNGRIETYVGTHSHSNWCRRSGI